MTGTDKIATRKTYVALYVKIFLNQFKSSKLVLVSAKRLMHIFEKKIKYRIRIPKIIKATIKLIIYTDFRPKHM